MANPDHPLVIDSFRAAYGWLSNFSAHPAEYAGVEYRSAEHAFAAAKTTDRQWVSRIAAAAGAREAKALGRQAPLRPNWNSIRVRVMAEILASKFTRDPALGELLIGTGDRLLIESNTWGDDFWGRCLRPGATSPVGANMLGRTLMRLRRELAGVEPQIWPRVALTGHREHLIGPADRAWVRAELDRIAVKLRDHHGTETASTGLATGGDTWWGQSAESAGLAVWAYQPFPEQPARWNAEQRAEHARLCKSAQRLVLVGGRAEISFFDLRNQLLLGDAEAIVAVRDPRITRGGTVSALRRYAAGTPVITVDPAHRTTTLCTSYDPNNR
ncbi:NADAR family protein [Nocardia brasiliensis]|uniref:NADAR family protein n=1 Tax=Nocardia brasiliensis TaxID=37326 RepID=UPI002458FA3C|nr:NADAR family protein [Nocardia brasiliensis]